MLNSRLFLALIFSTPIISAVPLIPPPDGVKVRGINYGGSGCPAGSLGQFMNTDSMSVVLDDFQVTSLPSSPQLNRKNCRVGVNLIVPTGYKLQVSSEEIDCFQYLSSTTSFQFKDTIYYDNSTEKVSLCRKIISRGRSAFRMCCTDIH